MATRRWDELRDELIARRAARTGDTVAAIEARISAHMDDMRLDITRQAMADERDLDAWQREMNDG